MKSVINALGPYAKSVIPLALIVLAIIADGLGVDVGLDVEHYVALLLADFAVYAVPNKAPIRS